MAGGDCRDSRADCRADHPGDHCDPVAHGHATEATPTIATEKKVAPALSANCLFDAFADYSTDVAELRRVTADSAATANQNSIMLLWGHDHDEWQRHVRRISGDAERGCLLDAHLLGLHLGHTIHVEMPEVGHAITVGDNVRAPLYLLLERDHYQRQPRATHGLPLLEWEAHADVVAYSPADMRRDMEGTGGGAAATRHRAKKIQRREASAAVLIISAAPQYMDDAAWQALQASPGARARKWLATLLPRETANTLGDTFHWRKTIATNGKELVEGMLRARKSTLAEIIKLSGKKAERARWFVKQPGAQCDVSWQWRRENESWLALANRLETMAGPLGVARGDQTLRTWQITGIPHDVTGEELPAMLKELAPKLDQIEVMSRSVQRKQARWTFKAQSPKSFDSFEGLIENNGSENAILGWLLQHQPKQGKGKPEVEWLPREWQQRRYQTREEDEEDEGAGLGSQRPAAGGTQEETEKHKTDAAGDVTERTARATSGPAPAPKRAKLQAPPAGCRQVRNAGQGNCLPEAISQYLTAKRGKSWTHPLVRTKIVEHIKKHAKGEYMYETYWDKTTPDQEQKPFTGSFSEYCDAVGKDKAWMGALEVQAAARTFGVDFYVFMVNGEAPICYRCAQPSGGNKPALCYLWWAANHWEWLEGAPEKALSAEKTTSAVYTGMRGGVIAPRRGFNPMGVRFTQANVVAYFQTGYSIEAAMYDCIQRGRWIFPTLRITLHQGYWYSLDNRRLLIARLMYQHGYLDAVPVTFVPPPTAEFWRKWSDRYGGETVEIRHTRWNFHTFPVAGLDGGCRWLHQPVVSAKQPRQRRQRRRKRKQRSLRTTLPKQTRTGQGRFRAVFVGQAEHPGPSTLMSWGTRPKHSHSLGDHHLQIMPNGRRTQRAGTQTAGNGVGGFHLRVVPNRRRMRRAGGQTQGDAFGGLVA